MRRQVKSFLYYAFFYADDVPTLFVPSNHLQNTQKLHDIVGAYVLDTNLGEESPSFRYGYNAYLLAKYHTMLLAYPKLSIATEGDGLSLSSHEPIRISQWKQATHQGLKAF